MNDAPDKNCIGVMLPSFLAPLPPQSMAITNKLVTHSSFHKDAQTQWEEEENEEDQSTLDPIISSSSVHLLPPTTIGSLPKHVNNNNNNMIFCGSDKAERGRRGQTSDRQDSGAM